MIACMIIINKKHLKWKSSRIKLEKSKETRGHLQTGDVRNPTPLHERHGFMYSLVSGSLCGY